MNQQQHIDPNCPCDQRIHPKKLDIPAGLRQLPRQIATFPEFRSAMLAAISPKYPLHRWNARKEDDYGVMLLEMWAYICDSLSFYDQVISQEAYIRTAHERSSLQNLVQLLGYIPRPAIAATVLLAAIAEGSKPLVLPKGLAFRSGPLEDGPPQIFELDSETSVSSYLNSWSVLPPVDPNLKNPNPSHLHVSAQHTIEEDTLALLLHTANMNHSQGLIIKGSESVTGIDGQIYTKIDFRTRAELNQGTPLRNLRLHLPTQIAPLWTIGKVPRTQEQMLAEFLANNPIEAVPLQDAASLQASPTEDSVIAEAAEEIVPILFAGNPVVTDAAEGIDATLSTGDIVTATLAPGALSEFVQVVYLNASVGTDFVVLDKLYEQIKMGQYVVLSRFGAYRPFRVVQVAKVMRQPAPTTTATINGFSYDIPSISVPVTKIWLDTTLNNLARRSSSDNTGDWTDNHAFEIQVHYEMVKLGRIVNLPESTLSSTDPIHLKPEIDPSIDLEAIRTFLMEDKYQDHTQVSARLRDTPDRMSLNQGQGWENPLHIPVSVYGNAIQASRGETVNGEILGAGDGREANQKFELKKSPLTYLTSPFTVSGVVNTLEVFVDGIRWQEVRSFFGLGEEDQVYILRQDIEEKTHITFGDGIRGQRLPTGAQVVANYRFGAGAASPPIGSISQIATPVQGLQSVQQPVPASGGADAEPAEGLRTYAPASALILDRAVSIPDIEAVALSIPGVRRVQVEWRWNSQKQRPLVALWFIGEANLSQTITEKLRNLCDPNTPFHVTQAKARKVNLTIDVQIDARYVPEQVLAEVRSHLIEQESGILRTENQQIGYPFYRSRLFEAVLAVPGTLAVTSVIWNKRGFRRFAKRPRAGKYFDFEQGSLLLNHNKQDVS